MNPVRNDLPLDTRTAMVELLNARLADAIDLALQLKHAHWNVKGAQFIAIHELFDQIEARVAAAVDNLAERAVQLGGVADGAVRSVAAKTTLAAYPHGAAGAFEHVRALADAMSATAKQARAAIDLAAQKGDAVTADLFTEVAAGLDKDVWFLEAHLG